MVGLALWAMPLQRFDVPHPLRRTGNLRVGRLSLTGARYFVTACTKGREPVFADDSAAECVRQAMLRLVSDADAGWLAGTVMPDHIHLLIELGERLPFEGCLAKVKGLTSRALSPGSSVWQENAFEHRLRAHESAEAYAFYIFTNPYRAGLVRSDEVWRGWVCSDSTRFQFLEALSDEGVPPVE